MIYPQMLLDLSAEIHGDAFAGGGGASVAFEMATGRSPDFAINHDPEAVAMHRINHPQTRHYRSDIFEVDPREATRGRPVGSMWFSPDCTFFSKSRGGKPIRHGQKKRRALAWIVKRWAGQVRPRVIFLENVEEFAEWCPLVAKRDPATGRVIRNDEAVKAGKPRVAAKGERVPVEDQQLVPCPMRTSRTFRQWKRQLEAMGYQVEHRELRACDYGAPTIRKRLFLIARCDGRPIVWPEPTHGPAGSGLLPYRTAAECIDWSIPMCSIFATPAEARAWAKANGQHTPKRPLASATMRRLARGVMRFVLRNPKPYIVGVGGRAGQSPERPLDLPYQTITAKGDAALVAPILTEHANASQERNFAADEPLRTQMAGVKGGHFAVVAPYLVPRYGEREGQEPRVRDIQEPSPVVVPTGNGAMLAAAHLESYHAEKREGEERGAELTDPMATLDTSNRHAVVAAWLAKNFTGVVGSPLEEPKGTVTTIDHDALVAAHLTHFQTGEPAGGSSPDEPMRAILSKGKAAVVFGWLAKYYGEGVGQEADSPAPTVTTKDRFSLVTVLVKGIPHVLVDVAMRMLWPRELYLCQGFPRSYIMDRGLFLIRGKLVERKLTKTAQVRMVGNSVSPHPGAAIIRANVPELVVRDEARPAQPKRRARAPAGVS